MGGRPPLARLAMVEAGSRGPISLGQFVKESVEMTGLQQRRGNGDAEEVVEATGDGHDTD